MPEPLLFIKAVALAAVLAGAIQLLFWWLFTRFTALRQDEQQETRPGRLLAMPVRVGGAMGVGVGFVAGAWALGLGPRWPPSEDRDRLFLILVPAALLVECLAALPRMRPWLAWVLRLALSAAAAPILLHASIYLSEPSGPGSRQWTDQQMVAWLTGMATALFALWAAASALLGTRSVPLAPFALAIAAGGAGVTIMLSGYLAGGELALPLAGALAGTALAALGLRMLKCNTGAVGVGVIGLFGVVVIGRFFGELTTLHGVILLAAPVAVCVPEFLPRRISYPWLRGALAVVLVVVPIALVAMQAHDKFIQDSEATSNPGGATADDYTEYK